jgi:hypothetical protein
MADEPAYMRNLRAITRADPQLEHLEALERELYASTSSRATVVMFGSFVETSLERLLASVMRENLNSRDRKQLFEYEGAVGTFSSKIVMAYALKLIGRISRADLDIIRFLRNEFAHSRIPFDFDTPEVRAVCDKIKIVDLPPSTIPHGYIRRGQIGGFEAITDLANPKTRFITACHSLSYRILVKKGGFQAGDFVFPDDEPLP